MSFRTKLFLLFLVTVLASVSAVTYSVTHYTRAAYEEADMQRTQALVEQFQKEFAQQRELVARQVENVTNSEFTLKMAIDLERTNADQSLYARDAAGAAQEHGLNFMEFVMSDGTLIPGDIAQANGDIEQPERFAPIIAQIQKQPAPLVQTIQWTSDAASAESFHVLPLTGRSGELLGALLVGSSRSDLVLLIRH